MSIKRGVLLSDLKKKMSMHFRTGSEEVPEDFLDKVHVLSKLMKVELLGNQQRSQKRQ